MDGGGITSGVSKGKSSSVRRSKRSAVRDSCSSDSSPDRAAPSAPAIDTINMDSDSECSQSLPDPDNQLRSTHNLHRYVSPYQQQPVGAGYQAEQPGPTHVQAPDLVTVETVPKRKLIRTAMCLVLCLAEIHLTRSFWDMKMTLAVMRMIWRSP